MAYYASEVLRWRGRVVEVSFRYRHYNGAVVRKGKPFTLPDYVDDEYDRRVVRSVLRVLMRRGCVNREGLHEWYPDDD